MLYVTTGNNQEVFTNYHVRTENRGMDGGLFVPLKLPRFSPEELNRLREMSFGHRISEILNLFFSEKLTGWDVEFSIGRYPVRMEQLAHKIIMAETWHNPDWHYKRMEKNLTELLCAGTNISGNWVSVAIKMSVFAGIFGSSEMFDQGPVDIAVVSGDFTDPISAWYLRKMGFPVGNIICCCNENNQIWDLLCNGQMHTNSISLSTIVPEADISLPENLERLIFDCGGTDEAKRFKNCCRAGSVYAVSETMLQNLRQGLLSCVVSSDRVRNTIPNVFKSHKYLLSPSSALAYSGMLDYRSKTGITRTAVIICDRSPICDLETISNIMDISVSDLKKLV